MTKKQLNIFKNLPELETKRLILKKITVDTLIDVHEYRSDESVSKYLLWNKEKSLDETRIYLEYLEELYRKGKFYDFGIFLKENGKMIGTVGFATIDLRKNEASVGYVLNSNYWGRGIASEALQKIVEFGFFTLGFKRLFAKFAEPNVRSRGVLLKCGFKHYGEEDRLWFIKEKSLKVLIYSLDNNNR